MLFALSRAQEVLVITLLFGFVACVGPVETPADGAPEQDTAGAHLAIDPPHQALQLTAEEALATVEETLAEGLPDVLNLHALYEEVMGHRELGDPGCPVYENADSTGPNGNWFDRGCTTTEGWTYFGNATALHIIGINPDGYPIDAVGSSASFQVTDPNGATFVGGGGYNLDRLLIEDGVGRAEGQLSFRELIVERGETMLLSGQIDLRDPSGYWFHLALEGSERPCGTLSAEGLEDQDVCLSDHVVLGLDALLDSMETM